MAGDWIKLAHATPDKPEVWQMAARTGLPADEVVGKLVRVWIWFDVHTENGNAAGVSLSLVDRIAGVTGFAEAMLLCGWLEQRDTWLVCPNFSRHNGKSAKNRALTAERVAKSRANGNADRNADTVTKSVTREEKRREEETPPNPRKRGSVHEFPPGFERFWSAYPRKEAKPRAVKAFARIKPTDDLLARMLAAVEKQKESPQWLRDGGSYIPHAATWLNDRRWEDVGAGSVANDAYAGAL